jgi:hypothetical protein
MELPSLVMFWPVGRYRDLPRGGDHSGSDRPGALPDTADAPDANTRLNAPEPVEARTAEQDEVDQQTKDEQESEQAYECSARIEDLPNFMHLRTPVTNRWVLLDQQTPGGPSIAAPLPDQSQGRHSQTRMCATTTIDVNATKLDTKMP